MKKIISLILISLILPTTFISTANAGETIYHYGDGTSGKTPPTPAQAAVGGFAVVNPETGVVHGVITGSVEYFNSNNRTMDSEYMGCSAGCLIVQQSTSTQDGNVVGFASTDTRNVSYIEDRNVFQVEQFNTVQSQTVTEFASNSSTIETEIKTFRSSTFYEFGVQDFRNSNGQFQMIEVAPPQSTSAKIDATTKEYACVDREMLCSRSISDSATILVDESVLFSERSTGTQVLEKVISEAKNKVREQINLILTMLGKWIIE